MNTMRRRLLQAIGTALICAPHRILHGQASAGPRDLRENFRYIYGSESYRREFKSFLENVFHLYPEDELHELIHESADRHADDIDVYRLSQSRLDEIKPLLGDLTYALPALRKQKTVLTDQTARLISTDERYEGYLEVGSEGRYLDSLEERFAIAGDRFFVSETAPGYSLVDILDRGQLFKAGPHVGLDDYRTDFASLIPRGSIGLATVFIGFHHCPVPLREEFMGSLAQCLKPGGYLVVRDHDVRDEKMWHMVALAHDVFNMGTAESWSYNERELRNFYSLDTLDGMLADLGFERGEQRLLQEGDPTLNTLMAYRKR